MRGARRIVPLSYPYLHGPYSRWHVPVRTMLPISPRRTVRSPSPLYSQSATPSACETIPPMSVTLSPARGRSTRLSLRGADPGEVIPGIARTRGRENKRGRSLHLELLRRSAGHPQIFEPRARIHLPHSGLPPLGKGRNGQEDSTRDGHSRIHVQYPERSRQSVAVSGVVAHPWSSDECS